MKYNNDIKVTFSLKKLSGLVNLMSYIKIMKKIEINSLNFILIL